MMKDVLFVASPGMFRDPLLFHRRRTGSWPVSMNRRVSTAVHVVSRGANPPEGVRHRRTKGPALLIVAAVVLWKRR